LEKSVENIGRLSEEYDQSLVLSLMSGGVDKQTSISPENSDIPEDWDVVKIEDVAQVETGGTPKTSVDEYWGGDITWIRVSDMPEDMYVSDSEDKITETGLKEGSCSLIDEGGVVLSTRATIGEVAVANKKLATNQGFKSMIPKTELNSKYLAYYLDSITPYLESLGKGATYDEINKGQVQNIRIPLPPIAEQENIVNKIESFDSEKLRIAVESVEDLFIEYKNSILSHAFKGQIDY
jgi:type I restriction enzyme S subunit